MSVSAFKKPIYAFLLGTSLLGIASCAPATLSGRQDLATNIAAQSRMVRHNYKTEPFELTGYQRITTPSAPLRLYIEGDGLAWLSKSTPSLNPTPTEPIAFKLAAKDNAPNVAWLARPCQYTGKTNGSLCEMDYWTGKRYAPEVLRSYNSALDKIKQDTGISSFELVGFSGGGTVAALLAGQRNDIVNLRSVAGNLDHRAHSEVHSVSYLNAASLNPPQYAAKLASVPQYHFIGADDPIVPRQVYDRYLSVMPSSACIQAKVVPGASHNEGWIENWPSLLPIAPSCRNAI